ncbi:MAG: S1 RNA-binding domain-containing protein [Clostridia bacterium]|nr:S1 RNA-binding domain-containing protein [Clostridia bacterium]
MADVAEIFEGRVFSIMNFGAFVRLKDGSTGLVHISEISDGYVQDVKDYLKVGQNVKVAVLSVEPDGKKKLSIKRVASQPRLDGKSEAEVKAEKAEKASQDKKEVLKASAQKRTEKKAPHPVSISQQPAMYDDDRGSGGAVSFEDKLAKFMKSSEERLVDIKHQKENKRGGGYVRR